MDSSWCPVHADYENCLEWRLATLKVAVAFAVLRNRPPGQSVRQFISTLTDFHQNKEEKWKAEYHRLKQEVLQLRQKVVLLSTQQSLRDTQPLSDDSGFSQMSNYSSQQSLDLLTLPVSQSLDTQPALPFPQRQEMLPAIRSFGIQDGGSEFLRAFFYLEHRLRADREADGRISPAEISENDVISRSVFAVLRHVRRGTDSSDVTFKTFRDGLQICLQFLDHQSTWTAAIRDELADIAGQWLDSLHKSSHTRKAFALLIILAESHGMAIALADFLANRMVESQKNLSTWNWDGHNFLSESILRQFCSASYYLLLLEKTIPQLPSDVKLRLIGILSNVEPQVHNNFPLVSLSILRLVSLLSSST